MTTLGDVFSKLSGVRLLSILKWYGRIVMWTAFAAVVLALMTAVTWIVVLVIASIPWWVTVGFLVLVSAWAALKIADPDFMKDDFDRHMDDLDRQLLHKKAVAAGKAEAERESPYNFNMPKEIRNWDQIRELVASLDADTGCAIEVNGKPFVFPNRQEALDFLNGKKSQ